MRNIIITGGELFNKGAQAMVFTTVSELKKRYPNHRILVLSEMDNARPEKEKEKYAFEFLGWYPIKFAKAQNNPLIKLLCMLRNRKEYLEAVSVYSKTDLMLDISGYAYSDMFDVKHLERYGNQLEFAKLFNIPVYMMPQSFGPFSFTDESGKREFARINKLLSEAKCICAREENGYHSLLEAYPFQNVVIKPDLVLSSKGYDRQSIYRKEPEYITEDIMSNSVALIPNSMLYRVMKKGIVDYLYDFIIEHLTDCGKNIYIVSHSTQDNELCSELYDRHKNIKSLHFINKELSCLDFNDVVKKMDFVIASRFHAVVHAFKNGIPSITLGWAEKYVVLHGLVDQSGYVFDARSMVDEEQLLKVMNQMIAENLNNHNRIKAKINAIQEENVFDILPPLN